MSIIKTIKSRVCPRVELEKFDSTLEFLETCKNRENVIDGEFDFGSFTGCKSYEDALKLLNNGWQDKVCSLQKKLQEVERCVYEKRIVSEQSVEGFAPIVPLALNRVPNAMLNAKYKPIKTKTVNLIYDISCAGGWDEDEIAKNGEKIIETIVKLEKSGYRVNFNIGRCVCNSSRDCVALLINVKPANQLIDLKRLTFPVMHRAMLRVFGFDWYYKFPNTIRYSGNGHSVGYQYDEDDLQKFAQDVFGKESVYITRPKVQEKSEDELRQYILDKLGGEIIWKN